MEAKRKVWNSLLIISLVLILVTGDCKKESDTKKQLYTVDQPIEDNDGNVYKTVKIGSQVWMAENLKTTRLNDGTIIPLVWSGQEWKNLTTPGYWGSGTCVFYNGYAINTGNLCPTGWHVPEYNDLTTLINYLGGSSVAGGKMKSVSPPGEFGPNVGATNESGFSAGFCGYRIEESPGQFLYDGTEYAANFLASGSQYSLGLGTAEVYYSSLSDKNGSGNIRCLKNEKIILKTLVDSISFTTARVGGNLISNGGTPITEHGVYWGTSWNPETTGTRFKIGTGTGSFSATLSGLSPSTFYYVTSYAINSQETAYGIQSLVLLP